MRAVLVKILLVGLLVAAVSDSARSQPSTGPATAPALAEGRKSITLPSIPLPDFPSGPGREQFLVSCAVCHSPRYVTMQPPFSRKVWVAEVEKMKKVFGAPLTDDQATQIVDYLVQVRGTPSNGSKP